MRRFIVGAAMGFVLAGAVGCDRNPSTGAPPLRPSRGDHEHTGEPTPPAPVRALPPSGGTEPVEPAELELPPRRPGVDTDAEPDTDPEPDIDPEPDPDAEPDTDASGDGGPVEAADLPRSAPPTDDPEPVDLDLPPRRPDDAEEALTKPDVSAPSARACATHRDCVITCAMDCCGAPCGCRSAYNREVAADIEAWGTRDCPVERDCPAVGCAYEPAFGAVCRDGVCQPVDSPTGW